MTKLYLQGISYSLHSGLCHNYSGSVQSFPGKHGQSLCINMIYCPLDLNNGLTLPLLVPPTQSSCLPEAAALGSKRLSSSASLARSALRISQIGQIGLIWVQIGQIGQICQIGELTAQIEHKPSDQTLKYLFCRSGNSSDMSDIRIFGSDIMSDTWLFLSEIWPFSPLCTSF